MKDADKANTFFVEISEMMSLVSNMSHEILAAANTQSKVSQEVNQAINVICDTTNGFIGYAEGDLKQAQELKSKAHELQQQIGRFVI